MARGVIADGRRQARSFWPVRKRAKVTATQDLPDNTGGLVTTQEVQWTSLAALGNGLPLLFRVPTTFMSKDGCTQQRVAGEITHAQ